MSEENTTQTEANQVNKPSTEASQNNVSDAIPKSRFDEVNTQKNDYKSQVSDLQSQLDKFKADQEAAITAAYEPYGRLSQYGQGLTGLSGGVASAPYAQPTPVSPMSQAIGTALGVGGLYGKIFGFPADRK